MEECLRGALQAVYGRHFGDVTSLSCYLERQLPLREPFYQLKRVPHFQVRDDLHHCHCPAYTPILRLESATPEDLSQRSRAGCRRVLVEGDLGTGKTFLCYHLLQQWAQPRTSPLLSLSKSPRLDDISTFRIVVYVDCVRLPISDFLAKCCPGRRRHVHVLACTLTELVQPEEGKLFMDRAYDWLMRNQPDVCVVFDNVDASDTWQQLIEESLREHHGGLGKILVCCTPGRVSKKNIDSLFYCYGLHPDYSSKLVVSRLKRVSQDLVERASIPKALDPSQELLRNPLTQSLVASYLKQMKPKLKPQTQFEFIEEIVSTAMVGDSYPVTGSGPGMPRSTLHSPVTSSPTSLMSICETVAFECLESNTNYFCKFKFPVHFWAKHLCDCRILHEVHHVAKQGSPVVSFTSRCIRDYLASKRVCRYLLSDRDSAEFLDALIFKRQFHSVVKFCIRQLVKLGRLDIVQTLLEKLLTSGPKKWVRVHKKAEAFSRGRLSELKEVLSWLRETDFRAELLSVVGNHLPAILELSYADCCPDTIRDFVRMAERASVDDLQVQGIVLYMDGMFMKSALGLDLARALRRMTSLTTFVVCLRCVVDTGFVVNFLCQLFRDNRHVRNLTLEGPFNSAENLTPAQHRLVREVFGHVEGEGNGTGAGVGLQNLCLEHINYHHRLAYLLSCWPNVFHRLELRKSNLDSSGPRLAEKLSQCRHLSSLVVEHCHVLTATLEKILRQLWALRGQLVLKTLSLSLVSTARHFTRSDAKRPNFKPSLSLPCCRILAQFISESSTLSELTLSYDAIDDVKFRVLADAASKSASLTSLDLTGNVISDEACDDVAALMFKAEGLNLLCLHENNLSSEIRSVLVNRSLDKLNLKLSL